MEMQLPQSHWIKEAKQKRRAAQVRRPQGGLPRAIALVFVSCLASGALAQSDPDAALAAPKLDLARDGQGIVLQQSRKLQNYRDAIARLETSQGAWGDGLAEQLGGLGRIYQLRGQHRDAIAIFDRAIHVSRINNGLYDLGQVPIVEGMLESLKARGRWEEVHKRHQYLFWLHKRNFGANDPRMLPVIDKLGKWYINDYALNPERRMMKQLVDAYNLFEHAIGIISGTYGTRDLRLVEPLRGLVMSNWFFASRGGSAPTSNLERSQLTREFAVAQQVSFPEEQVDTRLTRYLSNNYADGKRAIEKMTTIYSENPDAPPGAAAQAKVELADWEQLFGHHRKAATLYREAYRELNRDERTRDQARKLFARPVALPALAFVESDMEQSRADESDDGSAEPIQYVLVTFDVNRLGKAQDVRFLDSRPEDNADHRSRVKRTLESTRFRPRVVDGEPVDTEGLTQKFVFTR